jgi:hypothetical protein
VKPSFSSAASTVDCTASGGRGLFDNYGARSIPTKAHWRQANSVGFVKPPSARDASGLGLLARQSSSLVRQRSQNPRHVVPSGAEGPPRYQLLSRVRSLRVGRDDVLEWGFEIAISTQTIRIDTALRHLRSLCKLVRLTAGRRGASSSRRRSLWQYLMLIVRRRCSFLAGSKNEPATITAAMTRADDGFCSAKIIETHSLRSE